MSPIFEEVKPETAAMIAAEARAKGLTVDSYLRTLLGVTNSSEALSIPSPAEFEADLMQFSEGTEHLPPTSLTYSREDIYFDHD